MIRLRRTDANFEREALSAPMGFKGGYISELWQTAAMMESLSGQTAVGLGTQSILWSDAAVFQSHSQAAGNSLMFLLTDHALRLAEETPFTHPMELLKRLLPAVFAYGKRVAQNPELRMTFALNALVAVDNAAWLLYCRENGIDSFDAMLPPNARAALSARHERLAAIPLVTYGIPVGEVARLADEGHCLLKIKLGSDPAGDGDPQKMLEWDKRRMTDLHEALREKETPLTDSGHILYYFDINGRYDTKDRLLRLLDHADAIGALERILLLEEPFPETMQMDVRDIPVRLAADESAHSDVEALERMEMGYGAIALKPAAKTLSMSLNICRAAHERGIPCFCADLTVNPILVDWNKNVAARLATLPGLKCGVLESNGAQNYARWRELQSFHPCAGAAWTEGKNGQFVTDDDFYSAAGGIFETSVHYAALSGAAPCIKTPAGKG